MRDHELRNELTVILGFSELLIARTAAGDPTRADLEAIRHAATSALRLLDSERRPAAPLRALSPAEGRPIRRPGARPDRPSVPGREGGA
jgi:signal transduction histidine kinase